MLQPAFAGCRQALALGLDVSGSVDDQEYRLQLDGLAAALDSAEVRAALLSNPSQHVAVYVFEWSGLDYQNDLVPWTFLQDGGAIDQVRNRLITTVRDPAPSETALGSALIYGAAQFASAPSCTIWTMDISGDGKSNVGPRPQDSGPRSAVDGITVNGLVVGADDRAGEDTRAVEVGELSAYFKAYVINGPFAFVQVALGFEDYERAMKTKLLRELEGMVIGGLSRDLSKP